MSAFILLEKHINTLITSALFASRYGYNFGVVHNNQYKTYHFNDTDILGQILVNQNYKSVNYRYDENEIPYKYHFKYTEAEAIQILKACDCYDYQSCETEDYYSTEACAIIERIRRDTISTLPGYNDALWDVS